MLHSKSLIYFDIGFDAALRQWRSCGCGNVEKIHIYVGIIQSWSSVHFWGGHSPLDVASERRF